MKKLTRLTLSSATVALALVVSGCQIDGGPDITDIFSAELDDTTDLSVRVKQALKRTPQTSFSRILVTKVGDDTVKLSGFVQNDATSYEAERVAGQVAGVRHVFNSLVVE